MYTYLGDNAFCVVVGFSITPHCPPGWITDCLPPPINLVKLSDYIERIANRTIVDKTQWSFFENQYINPGYVQVLGKITRFVTLKNRKKQDVNFAEFELTHGSQNDGQWGLTEPSLNAYYKGIGKLNKAEHLGYDEDAWNFAFSCWVHHFYPFLKDSKIETLEESLQRHDRSKSPGPPWYFVFKDKTQLLDDSVFLEFCRLGWEWLLESDRWFLGGTALKEEVRPEEKLQQDKQRIFVPGSADFVTNTNRLCGDFNDKFTACCLQTASAVGVSPFYGGWQRVRDKLSKHPNGAEYDASDYDSSLGVLKMLAVCKFRFMCMRPEERTFETWVRLCNLYKNLIWTVCVLHDGTLIIKPGGNPSGGANTVVDNTLINYFSQAYAWYRSVSPEFRNYESFDQHVSAVLYGDDNDHTVSDVVKDQFTPDNFVKATAELGITFNPVSKDWMSLSEMTFLQADFNTYLYGICIYHVSPSKSYESMKWSEDCRNPVMSLQRACGMYLITWSDETARNYYKRYIDFLMHKYNPLLSGVKAWEDAKAGYKPDWAMASFYTGLECKDQKDFQANDNVCEEIVFEEQARRNKRKGKKGKQQLAVKVVGFRGTPPRPPPRSRKQLVAIQKTKKRNFRGISGDGFSMSHALAPVAMGTRVRMGRRSRSPTVISETEYLGPYTGTTAFTAYSFSLNPGLPTTFPWLSQIASRFEQYRFLSLEFMWVTSSSTATTGTIGMAFDPDALDALPTTKQQIMAYENATTDVGWKDMNFSVPPKSKFAKSLFIRTGTVSGTDLKTYDLGNFLLAFQGGSSVAGELYVRYKVALITPDLQNSTGYSGNVVTVTSAAPTTSNLFTSSVQVGSTGMISTISNNNIITLVAKMNVLVLWNVTATTSIATPTIVSNGTTGVAFEGIINAGLTQMIGYATFTGASTISFAATLVLGLTSEAYIAVLPNGVTLSVEEERFNKLFSKMGIDFEKLKSQFAIEQIIEGERDATVEEIANHIRKEEHAMRPNMSDDWDRDIPFPESKLKMEQDKEELLAISEDEEVYIDASRPGLVRLYNKPPMHSNYEPGHLGHGSAMHRNTTRSSVPSVTETIPIPTEKLGKK